MQTKKIILITGASSGIGRASALYLDRAGYCVIAGVRRQEDAARLRQESSAQLNTVCIDVRDAASTAAAAAEVAQLTDNRLDALVNNAGVALGGPLEIMQLQDIRAVLETNIAGVLSVTQAFLPLLRNCRGRIINMGSSSGIVALPALSAYAASKFALRGLSDSLRVELRPFGISVSVLEAGNIQTPIWDKGLQATRDMLAHTGHEIKAPYAPLLKSGDWVVQSSPKLPVERVSRKIEKILRARQPRAYYSIGADVRLLKILRLLPCRVKDWLISAALQLYGRTGSRSNENSDVR